MNSVRSRVAVMPGSFCRRLPAAALRGLVNKRSPAAPWRRFNASNAGSGMNTSPRTSSSAGRSLALPLSFCGTAPIVRRFSVTSSPVTPVAAGRAHGEAAVDVLQRDREPVELRLGDEADRLGDQPLDARRPTR